MLVDSHCHLDFPDYAEDLDATVERARAAGVVRMVTICTHLSRFDQVRRIAERYDDVLCTLGVHPHNAGEELAEATEERLVALSRHPKVIGLGETGLDYFYDRSPREAQQESFRRHIRACLETGLPLIVHTRDADEDTMRIIREEASGSALKGLLHCFSSGRQLAEQAVEFGLYLSLSGIVTFKKSEDLRGIVADVPLDRILVETDAPFLAPLPFRGKRNEPSYVAHTAAVVAAVKGVDAGELARRTTDNFFRLFDRAVPPPALAA
ncbi:TatD family hydrolase [Azospirillum sp. RWY-5-1]|uniref:TatD family hydrolase n=1 Tax=Azospirillum oleiclasticum TaxID=2735135 RepID=A0ABX2T5V9_9PROT|nr:TatD family hydrolase [Azospirillum oleiclasticum]NYZ12065.1 TatD family hydrolase [Azospirillum oleiclasticum]NYZ19225.1 TatD family hydrolase [Azospirillum oleiclasticum]